MLPTALLQEVESHRCFAGVFRPGRSARVCQAAQGPLEDIVQASCSQCFTYKVAINRSLCPTPYPSEQFARDISTHLATKRGFGMACGGYHAAGPGFWFHAAFLSHLNVFIVDGNASAKLGSDLDLLMLAFQHKVLVPTDPHMTDPKRFTAQQVFVNFSQPSGPIPTIADLLTSPVCSLKRTTNTVEATLLIFQPVVAQPVPAPITISIPKAPQAGDVCPVCNAPICERSLLNSRFVGCLC